MGDRGVVGIVMDVNAENTLYYYTHWSGTELADWTKEAVIAGSGRWGDYEYFTRRFIHELLVKDFPGGPDETGAGLSVNNYASPEHDLIIVDPYDETVTVGSRMTKFRDLTPST